MFSFKGDHSLDIFQFQANSMSNVLFPTLLLRYTSTSYALSDLAISSRVFISCFLLINITIIIIITVCLLSLRYNPSDVEPIKYGSPFMEIHAEF